MTRSAARSFTGTLTFMLTLAALLAGCTGQPPQPAPERETTPTAATPSTETTATDTTDVPVAQDLPELEDVVAPDYQPATRTEELALEIGTSGKPALQFAIDALDLYQPLPGATPTTLPKGDGLGLGYTLALVDAMKDRMSPEQRVVVDALDEDRHEIGVITANNEIVPADGGTAMTTGSTAPGTTAGTETAAPSTSTSASGFRAPGRSAHRPRDEKSKLLYTEQVLQGVMKSWQQYRPDLPHPAVQFSWSQASIPGQEMTSSKPSTSTPGLVEITMYNDLWNGAISWKAVEFIFAAEYFRAIQYTWSSGLTAQSPWVVQGSSEWAAYDLYRNYYAPDSTRTYAGWFKDQTAALGARAGSAWPFFESLHQYGVDPYPAIKTLLATGAAPVKNLLAAAGLDGMPFASFRSSQSVRRTAKITREFFMDWPGPSVAFGPQDNFVTADTHGRGRFTVFGGADYSHPQWAIPFADDVDTVTITPQDTVTTLTDDGTLSIPPGASITLCVKQGACQCPEGSSGSLLMARLPLIISLPEQRTVPQAVLTDDTFTTKDCRSTPRTARAIGDPHMVTFDGAPYDLTLPGEYVLLRDPETKAEMQVRVEDQGWMPAVAISDGDGHRLTFTAPADENGAPLLQVDGVPATTAAPTVSDRLQVTRDGDGWRLDGPDGLTIGLDWTLGFNITAVAGIPSAGRLEGLLGNGNGVVGDDYRLPDGTLDAVADDHFVSAWWVTDETTLFDYEDGRTTESYRKPKPVLPPVSDEDVSRCRDALGPDALGLEVDMCAFDIGVTGKAETITTIYVNVVQDRVDDFPALIAQPDLGDGDSDAPTTTTPGPSVGSVTGNGPALSLTGTVDESGEATGPTASGALALRGGTVLVARSTGCPAKAEVDIKVTFHDHSLPGVQTAVCDPRRTATDGVNAVVQGEAYVFVGTAGDYDIALAGFSADGEFATTVEIYADPSPQLLEAGAFDTAGFSGSLEGIGKAVLAWSNPGERTIRRAATGDIGELCVNTLYGPGYGEAGIWDLNSTCGHNPDQSTNPYPGQQLPYLIFSRTPGKHSIAITVG